MTSDEKTIEKRISEKIREILSSKLGDFVAGSLIRVNCKKIGIEENLLNEFNLPEFLSGLKVSLIIFLKEEEIEQTIQEINKLFTVK